jgi:hypothetical protein
LTAAGSIIVQRGFLKIEAGPDDTVFGPSDFGLTVTSRHLTAVLPLFDRYLTAI